MSLLLTKVGPKFNSSLNPLNDGLKWYYQFNGNTLKTVGVEDAIGVNVTYEADTTGQRAVMNGDGKILIDNSSDFNFGTNEFTINLDVIFTTINERQFFFGQTNPNFTQSQTSFYAEIAADNKISFYFFYGGVTFFDLTSSTICALNIKYIIIIKRVGDLFSMKINDVAQDTFTRAGAFNAPLYKMSLGTAGEYNGLNLKGKVCVFRGWDRATTDLEDTELYNGGLGLKFSSIPVNWNLETVKTQPIDGNAVAYATFQSNSQRTVVNDYGIFQVHLHSTDNPGVFLNQTWYLKQSTDGGRTFSIVYTNTTYDYVPVLETDSLGNLYLAYTVNGTTARLLKFLNTDYTTPSVTTNLPISVTSKFCMVLDDINDKIYYFNARGYLTILNKACVITTAAREIVTTGVTATIMYPSVTLDNSGNVYHAWTNQNDIGPTFYYNIRWAVSRNFGIDWQRADGTALTLPIVSDTGAEQVSVVGDLGVQNWLSAWTFANGRLHAAYWREGVAQKYVTINPTTAAITNSQNIVSSSDPGLDGFFMRDVAGTFGSPTNLFLLTTNTNRTQLALYRSVDNGVNWTTFASRYAVQLAFYYSICGYREQVSGYGYGILSLLTTRAVTYTENDAAYVYLTKLKLT